MNKELRIESGIELATIKVERQLPTNSSTVVPAKVAAISISTPTSMTEASTNED